MLSNKLPGTYLLLLYSNRSGNLRIGRLGTLKQQPGLYLYAGSAFGPGGVESRVRHHCGAGIRPHWHIDYLRSTTGFAEALCVYHHQCEHEWARRLLTMNGFSMPMRGFGASDCSCASHLYYRAARP